MHKQATVLFSIVAGVLILLLLLIGTAYAYLNSQHFQRQVVFEINRRTECQVEFDEMRIHLWRSVNLKRVRLSSARIRPNNFLQAERLHLHYNLADALFNHRITMEELTLSSPTIVLDLSETGNANRRLLADERTAEGKGALPTAGPSAEELPAATVEDRSAPATPGAATGKETPPPPDTVPQWFPPPRIDLEKLLFENGSLTLILPDKGRIVLRNTQIKAAFYADPVPSCMGSILCPSAELPQGVMLADARLDFLWRKDGFEIPRLKAKAMDGNLEAKFKMDATVREIPFELSLVVNGFKMAELLAACRLTNQGLEGILQAQATLQGSMLVPLQASGTGQVRVLNGHLVNVPALVLLGGFLNRSDEYRDLVLRKFEMDLMLQNSVLQVPRIQVASTSLDLQGNGAIKLLERSQDFQMKLAFRRDVASQLPPATTEGGTTRPDGYVEVPFRTWGSLSKPKSDLEARFTPIATRAWGGAFFDRVFQGTSEAESRNKKPSKAP